MKPYNIKVIGRTLDGYQLSLTLKANKNSVPEAIEFGKKTAYALFDRTKPVAVDVFEMKDDKAIVKKTLKIKDTNKK